MTGRLLRIDSKNGGIVYVRPEDVRVLGDHKDGTTNVGVLMASGHALDLIVQGEIDEVAAEFERLAPGLFDIIRIN